MTTGLGGRIWVKSRPIRTRKAPFSRGERGPTTRRSRDVREGQDVKVAPKDGDQQRAAGMQQRVRMAAHGGSDEGKNGL